MKSSVIKTLRTKTKKESRRKKMNKEEQKKKTHVCVAHSCVATILMESSPCLKILQLTKNICILHKIDYSSPFFLVYY